MNDVLVNYLKINISSPIVIHSPFIENVVYSIFYDKDYVFGSGKTGYYNRFHLIYNLFKYRWKYNDIYQMNIWRKFYYYITGYLLKTE
jgi:hypothetical protein